MKYISLFGLILSLWLITNSCIERIEVPNSRQEGTLNIDGLLTPTHADHRVRVGRISGNNRITEPVENATVVLFDDLGNEATYEHEEKGSYRLAPEQIERLPGRSYHIEVTLADGQQYRSLPEKMPSIVGSDSAYWVVTPNRDLDVFTDSNIPETEEPLYLRWVVEQNYMFEPTDFPDPFNDIPPPCFVWEYGNRQRILTHNGAEINTRIIPGQKVLHTPIDFRFKIRHFLLIEQLSITPQALAYWEKVKVITNNTGSIFDTPPAPITGNLYNINDAEEQVLGYFEVAKTDTAIIYITRGDIGFSIGRYCEYYPNIPRYNYYPDACLNCLTLRNSSYESPWFWR